MILYVPHIFGESLYECMLNAKEFESEEELREYFYNLYSSILSSFSKDDIIIGKILKEDDRMGMVDPRNVYVRMSDNQKKCTINDCILIGTCASKYKNLNDTMNENFGDMLNPENNLVLRR